MYSSSASKKNKKEKKKKGDEQGEAREWTRTLPEYKGHVAPVAQGWAALTVRTVLWLPVGGLSFLLRRQAMNAKEKFNDLSNKKKKKENVCVTIRKNLIDCIQLWTVSVQLVRGLLFTQGLKISRFAREGYLIVGKCLWHLRRRITRRLHLWKYFVVSTSQT